MTTDSDHNEQPERWPFNPPYTADDLPQLDRLHSAIGLGPDWVASERRAEIASERLADAGTTQSAPEPSQAATRAHGDDETAELVARVEAEADWLDAHHDNSLVTSDYPMIARRIRAALAGDA